MMEIRPYQPTDVSEWLRMRRTLWPDLEHEDQEADAAAWLSRSDATVIVAARAGGGGLAGFVEIGARAYADGCVTSPVAYLEGWYVDPDARQAGVGAALVRAGEAWACQQGYQEMGSDALVENAVSQQAHASLGFIEVERAVHYRKRLAG